MTRARRWSWLAAPLLLAAACSTTAEVDTDGTAAPGTTATAESDASGGTTPGTAAGSTSTTARSSTSTTSASTTSTSQRTTTPGGPITTGEVTPGSEPFCGRLASFANEVEAMEDSVPDGNVDLAELEQRYLAILKQGFAELAALAPTGVAADWAVMNDVLQEATSMVDLENSDAVPGFDEASERVEAWVLANCGIDLGAG